MQECGVLGPENALEDQEFDEEEDMRGIEEFLAWASGPVNKEIRRVALEGAAGAQEDYLAGLSLSLHVCSFTYTCFAVLKKKHSTTDEDSRYDGTVLGRPAEPRAVKVEGGEVANIREWESKLRTVRFITECKL